MLAGILGWVIDIQKGSWDGDRREPNAVSYGCTKNSDMEGADAAAAGGSGKASASIIVRSRLSC